MDSIEVYGALRSYVNASLVGVGALKGANCTIQSIETSGNSHVVTFAWKDDDDVTHTSTMTVTDGTNGTNGEDGTDGVGISSIEKTSTQGLIDTYTVTLTNAQTYTFTVTNGQDGTGGSVAEMTDVILTDLNDGQVLRYSTVSHKWINADFDYDDLSNKPSLGTAAAKDSTNAVTENSTDLIESGAVFSGLAAKANTADLGTAAAKNSTNQVTEDSTDLVESGAVQEAIASAISSVYKPCGNKAVAELTSDLLVAANLGNMYTTTDSGVTTADFIGGAGNTINAGDNVAVVEYSEGVYKFNLLSGAIDLSNYYTKTQTDSEIEEAVQALDVTDTAVAGSYVTGVSETDGKISVTREAADTNPTTSSKKMVTSGGVKTYVDGAIADLDVSDSAVAGSYVTTVSETDGKIAVTKEAADNTPTASSKKMVTSGGAYTAISANTNAINDIVNVYGAKNLIHYPFYETTEAKNGITFTDNGDGTITANGTATAGTSFNCMMCTDTGVLQLDPNQSYIVSCNDDALLTDSQYGLGIRLFKAGDVISTSTGENYNLIWGTVGNNFKFTGYTSCYIYYYIWSGVTINNVTFKPMIRLASIEDDTHAPYAETNYQLTQNKVDWKSNGVLGVKNSIPYPYANTTKTTNGVTFTDNGDGTITANGTATDTAYFYLGLPLVLSKGTYILSDSGDNHTTSVHVQLYLYDSPFTNIATTSKSQQKIFTLTENTSLTLRINVLNGTTVSNAVFYPMIRLATDIDSTYQPYAMTNRELTEDVIALNKLFGMKTFASYTEPADTSLTRNGMLDKALTNFLNNVVKGTEDNERILVTGITLAGSAAMSVTINSLQGNTTTSLAYRVFHKDVGIASDSLYSNEHCGIVKNSGSALYRIETTTSGATFFDYGSQTASAANNVVIYYFVLKRNG